jgi:hypothetical protein
MISLSSPADKLLRAQMGEAVAAVAEIDFPEQWPDLIDVSANINANQLLHVFAACSRLGHLPMLFAEIASLTKGPFEL